MEGGNPFWKRYPEKLVDAMKFSRVCHVSQLHESYIDINYFTLLCGISRQSLYKNKRALDPYMKGFLDENRIKIPEEWTLPVPNPDASFKSLSKYAKAIPYLDEREVVQNNRAWEWTYRHFHPYMGESIILPYDHVKRGLDMSSSSGLPFNKLYPTKAELFSEMEGIDEFLQQDWETLLDPKWTCLGGSSLKEEIRPLEKTLLNKIRTFISFGVDLTVHGNRLFENMNEKMYASYLQSSSAIGMSPLEGKWDLLYKKLNVFSKGYAMDESEYDSSLRSYDLWGCAQLRYRFLREEDQTEDTKKRIQHIYRNAINTLVATDEGNIIIKKGGMCSGYVNTVSDNTLILYKNLALAWIQNAPQDMNTYACFEDNTSKALVGDDNTWTVSDEAHPFFNATTVIKSWSRIGIRTTTDSMEPRPAKELDFLSAHTIFMHGKAVPLYDRNKLMVSLLYAPKKDFTPETTLGRAGALMLVGWTDQTFRKFVRTFIRWLIEKFDKVLFNDTRWILAKTTIHSDERLQALWLGTTAFTLKGQSYLESKERSEKPNKSAMQGSISRAERLMTKWVGDGKITEAGKDFLVAAMDPFHDTQLKELQGWPDLEVGASVVRCIKQTMNISATSGGAAAATTPWDCHVALLPWLSAQTFDVTASRSGNVFTFDSAVANSAAIGGLVAMGTFTTGTDVNWFPSSVAAGNLLGQLNLPATYEKGMGRVIGIGFEVVDTTADLYKQGSLVCYRQDETPKDSHLFCGFDVTAGSGVSEYDLVGTLIRMPPVNTAQAMLFPGSRQWAAREGAYVTGVFHSNENPPFGAGYNCPILMDVDEDETMSANPANTTVLHIPESKTSLLVARGGLNYSKGATPPCKLYPYHQSGIILSGLNPQSTFSVTMNVYYESFPNISEQEILVLATPSAEFDSNALNIYSHALSLMPVGVMVKENPFGEWFTDLVDTVSGFLSNVPGPIGMIAKGINAGVPAFRNAVAPEKKKRQPRVRQLAAPQQPPLPPRPHASQKKKKNKKKKKVGFAQPPNARSTR